jgi:WD40 repeat protein/transcriptional regulator with XRE-family HTH domain
MAALVQPSVVASFATFGDLLKYLRRRAGRTQLELSIAVGYSEAQISRLEQNQRLPDLAALQALFIPALDLGREPELATRLLALAESARQEDAPLPGVSPYKGLLFFDEADADLFFGREALTARLVERVNHLASNRPRLLAVVGASGSGKSSVVRAGLAVALKRMGWDVRVFTPTAQPLKMIEEHLGRGPENGTPVLGMVDQFEEIFTLCRDENARAWFIEQLLAAANEPNGRTTIALALRADFYSHCAQYPALRQAIAERQEYIGQMTPEELRRAIEEPAKRGGWVFESGLVDLMLSDVGAGGAHDQEPGALPLLSHALLATWERRRGRTFTFAGYRAAGGVRSAIAETAENVFADQLNQQQQRLARDIFLRLTELGEGTEDTRRRAGLNELVPRAEEAAQSRVVLSMLAEARLVMLGEDSAEVAHEALIREWGRLREWLSENREGLRLHRHVTEAAQAWDKSKRDEGELYRGARLAQAREWADAHAEDLNEIEREFLGASRQLREREVAEREAQRQRELTAAQRLAETQTRAAGRLRRRAIFLVGALIIAALLAASSAIFAQQSNANAARAEGERRLAFSRELSVNAVSNLDVDPERSILLALQAVSVSSEGGKPVLLEAEEALHRAVIASRVQLTLRSHTDAVNDVAYSPDGKRLITGSSDKTAKIWDAASGKELLTLSGHTDQVYGVAYSPDGTRVATASYDKTAKIWDATTGKELLTLAGHTDQVWDVAFSPDGRRIATSSADKTAKVWDAYTGKELLTLSGHTDLIRAIVYSPDGTRLYTGSYDKTAKAWDVTTGKELLTFAGHTSAIWSVAVSLDGTRLATGGFEGTAKLWDTASGRQLSNFALGTSGSGVAFNQAGTRLVTCGGSGAPVVWDIATGQIVLVLRGHTAGVTTCAFSPNLQGMRLATASRDLTARVWDISPSGERDALTFAGHSGRVHDVAYSPDGKTIASASADKSAKVWDATTGAELLTLAHAGWVRAAAFSPDGKRIATTADDLTAKVWDLSTGQILLTLPDGPPMQGLRDRGVTFSPDDKRLALTSDGNTAQVWDAISGQELLTLSGHTMLIQTVAYSPDGQRIATASQDRTAKVWDAATGKELLTLLGHNGPLWDLAFSRDGARIVTTSADGTAKVWDTVTGKLLLTLSGHSGTVLGTAFSPDGTHIATGSGDKTVKIWNVAQSGGQGEQPLTLYGATASVFGIAYSPDGKRLAAASIDGIVRVYALPLEDIIAIAKSRVTRTLTTDECQKYLHVDKCP